MANWADVIVTFTGDEAAVRELHDRLVAEHRASCPRDGNVTDACMLFVKEGGECYEDEHKVEGNIASFFSDGRWSAPWDYITALSETNPSLLFHVYQSEVGMLILDGTYLVAGQEVLFQDRAELEAFGHDWVLDAGSLTCCGWEQEEMEDRLQEGEEAEPDWTAFGNDEIEDWDTCFWEMRWVLAEQFRFDTQTADLLLNQRKVAA